MDSTYKNKNRGYQQRRSGLTCLIIPGLQYSIIPVFQYSIFPPLHHSDSSVSTIPTFHSSYA